MEALEEIQSSRKTYQIHVQAQDDRVKRVVFVDSGDVLHRDEQVVQNRVVVQNLVDEEVEKVLQCLLAEGFFECRRDGIHGVDLGASSPLFS